jgi:tetratricopeptide (TPR) repeat protein
MKNLLKTTAALAALAVSLLIQGCGPKPVPEQSLLDTPENHYNQGLRELKRGDLDAAADEFGRATALDPAYPGGYAGMGLVWSQKGEFPKALESADKALARDPKFIDGYVIRGRILTKQKKGEHWIENAVKPFDKALKLKPDCEPALFYKGEAFKEAYAFGDAAALFSRVIELKGDYSKAANAEWELVQKIQRAAPGTRIGMKIALIPAIDRADLAVLFVEELKLLEVLEKRQPKVYNTRFRPPEDPTALPSGAAPAEAAADLAGHWAANWIEDVIKAGAMDVFPDRTFRPDETITRSNYAVFLQNIIVTVTGDESLASKYFGSESRFPDVNPTNFAYNAICLAVDRGIMKTADPLDGSFRPKDPVSGADALLIIRDLQNALRMTF